MSDELIETKCEICNKVVKSHMWEKGYGGHSYGHKTLAPYQERRVQVPELEYGFDLLVCQDCIDKEPSLHSLILKKRKEWFTNEVIKKTKEIEFTRKQIQKLKKCIPLIYQKITILKTKQKELK